MSNSKVRPKADWPEAVEVVAGRLQTYGTVAERFLAAQVASLAAPVRQRILEATLLEAAREEVRRRTGALEAAAARSESAVSKSLSLPETREDRYQGKYPHGYKSMQKKDIERSAWNHGCKCKPCRDYGESVLQWQKDDEERSARAMDRLGEVIRQFHEDLRMEWTAELMKSQFALNDGTLVTWGNATVEQHKERVEMFKVNALANIEGAARHQKAIETIISAAAKNLSEAIE